MLANQVTTGIELCTPYCFGGIFYDIFLAEYEVVHHCTQIRYEVTFSRPFFRSFQANKSTSSLLIPHHLSILGRIQTDLKMVVVLV